MKISVIIPVYNSEKTIKKCIDSLLNQTFKDLEIILVNDASSDNSLNIINSYKNNNIIVINNDVNKGIGYSRNIGLKNASGEYISFVDSDDYVNNNAYEQLYNATNNNENDLVICNYNKIINNSIVENEYIFENSKVTLKSNPEMLLNINPAPWNKLYKKELVKNLYFPENLKYEDTIFVLSAINRAKSIKIISDKLYNYIVRDKSETTIVNEKVFDILNISEMVINELKNNIDSTYLEAFMVRNIFRYTLQQKKQLNKKLKYKFVDDAFSFLNINYPNWRKNKIYNKRNILKRIIEKNKLLTKIYITF